MTMRPYPTNHPTDRRAKRRWQRWRKALVAYAFIAPWFIGFIVFTGGPDNSTLFLGLYLFQAAFSFLNMGYASAMAWMMFLVIFLLTVFQFKLASRWVHYDA